MTAIELLALLNKQGVVLSVDGADLRISAPAGSLNEALKLELRAHKDELIELLADAPPTVSADSLIGQAGPQPRSEIPLSFAQERLWFLDQLQPGQSQYNLPTAVTLAGELNVGALQTSLNALLLRHEVLRTVFFRAGRDACARVNPAARCTIEHHDATHLTADEMASRITQLANEPFALASGPLLRAHLLQTAPTEHVLLLVAHHIVTDGISLGILMRELADFYRKALGLAGTATGMPPAHYADFAAWQRDQLQGAELERLLRYWRDQLAGAPLRLNLPTDHPRPTAPSYSGAWCAEVLPPETLTALRAMARTHDATLYTLLLTAFAALLFRYTGQSDLLIGSPVAGRQLSATEQMPGLFVNTVAIRAQTEVATTFTELLGQVTQTTFDALSHQSLPFEKLVEALAPARESAVAPIVQVLFNMQNREAEQVDFAGLTVLPTLVQTASAKLDLSVLVEDRSDGLAVWFEYSTELFTAATAQQMLAHYRLLLEGLLANPAQRISEMPLLTAAERTRALVEWNATSVEYPPDATLVSLFEAQVAATPAAPAINFESEALSYQDFNGRVNQLAHHLRDIGVMPDQMVGVFLERSVEMVVAIYGIVKAGGAYVPLDPEHPPARLQQIIGDAKIATILTHSQLNERLPPHQARVINVNIGWDAIGIANRPKKNPSRSVNPQHAAYAIFTSGSSGQPKGVVNEHRGIVNRLLWMQDTFPLDATDVVLQKTPVGFDVSVWELFWPLLSGARLVLARPGGHQDVNYLLELVQAAQVTTLHFVPSLLQIFLQSPKASECTAIRRVFSSGEALSTQLQQHFFEQLDAELHNLYGPTEAAIDVTWWPCSSVDSGPRVPIGRPVANTQIYVVDANNQLVPPGLPGELLIGGVQVARGYLNQPELTAERFVEDRFGPAEDARVYRTGDLARYRQDGAIEYLGRNDFQIKLRGVRIEPGEIEAILLGLDGIVQACVIAREDNPGEPRLAAYYVGSSELSAGTLRSALGTQLPDTMVPATFTQLRELPLTRNGKLDRRALPAPGKDAFVSADYQPPRTPLEAAVCEIFADILQRSVVGIHDDFFSLGGHSLLATRTIVRINETLNTHASLRHLFDFPTPAGLCAAIDATASLARMPAIVPRDADIPPPLSAAQQRMWILEQIAPGNPAYHIPWATRLRGAVDVQALQLAVNQLVARHESLRTSFAVSGGTPYQQIESSDAAPVIVARLSVTAEHLRKTLTTLSQKPFDFEQGPLLRITLLELSEDEHILHVVMHHIIGDAWSTTLLRRDLTGFYNAAVTATEARLPMLPVQYGDFAVWQQAQLQSATGEETLAFWREHLRAAPSALELPTDRPRPARLGHRGAWLPMTLTPELSRRIKQLSDTQNATLFMVLFTAFNVLLSRYSGQQDIVVGTPVAGRSQSALENLIGVFINTLPIRTQLHSGQRFTELLENVKMATLEAFEHQTLAFEQLVETLQPERDTSRAPVFQAMFILQNAPADQSALHELAQSPVLFDFGSAKLDLTLSMEERDDTLIGYLEYNADLFSAATIERLLQHYATLLDSIVANPASTVDALSLLTATERHQVLVEWNETNFDYPHATTLHGLFSDQAARLPAAIALTHGGEDLSYGELNRRANKLARHLCSNGIGTESLVAVCMERSAAMIVALLAIHKAGAAYVPIDPEYPAQRIAHMLTDSAASLILSETNLLPRLEVGATAMLCLDRFDWHTNPADDTNPDTASSADNLAYVIYTSGSTGLPKGVEVEHRNAVALAHWASQVFSPAELAGVLASTSICFDLSVFEIFVTLALGGRLILVRDALALPALERASAVTLLNTVPSAMAELVRVGSLPDSVTTVVLCGEPLSTALVNSIYACGRVKRVYDIYGPTEDTVYSTWTLRARDAAPNIGRPIYNTQAYVLDAQGQPSPIDVPGELFLSGAGVARGYRGLPELTAERFVDNPFSTDDPRTARCYRTGDQVRWRDDGTLEFLGRLDQQIKLRGHRIEPGEIEVVLNEHPAVEAAAVVARRDQTDDLRLVAYLVPGIAQGSEATFIAELRQHAAAALPRYMVPTAFVVLDALPRTPNGKLDREALPAPPQLQTQAAEYAAPRDPTERALAELWATLLGAERVGIHDDFFELGGHSLLAIQIVSFIRDQFAVEVPMMMMFGAPTVAELAVWVEANSNAGTATAIISRCSRDQPLPLSFAQQRLWFLDQLAPADPAYNIPWVIRLEGALNKTALRAAVNAVVRCHESLRTVFPDRDGEPVQIILPEPLLELNDTDCRNWSDDALTERLRELANIPMNLATGPLLHVSLLQTDTDEHLLAFVVHHIIYDAWSHTLVMRDLTAHYNATQRQQTIDLAPPAVEFVDYVCWQQDGLAAADYRQQLDYWRQQLAGAAGHLALPTDRPRPEMRSTRGATLTRLLAEDLHGPIKALASAEGVSLFVLLLAAFNALMARYARQSDLLVGTPISGRKRSELEDIVGFFLHTLVIRADLNGEPSFRELLARTQATVLDAFDNQDVPFEKLVEALDVPRDTSRHPLFQVHFVLQHADIDWQMFDGLTASPVDVQFDAAKFDIMFSVIDANDKLSVRLEYSTDLFDATTIERLIDHFERLLESILASPAAPVAELAILPPAERQQLIEWNDTTVSYPPDATLVSLFELQVTRTPDAPALRFEARELSYGELNQRVNQLAHHLIAAGIGPDVCVGVALERSVELVIALHAILKAGGAYVPLDTDHPALRLGNMLDDAQPQLIITIAKLAALLPETAVPVLELDTVADALRNEPFTNPAPRSGPANLAYVIFTSGSTGRPKGVMTEHRSVCNRLQWMQDEFRLSAADRVLQKTPHSFDVSVWELFWPLQTGAALVLARPGGHRDAHYLAELIKTQSITTLHFVPSMLHEFLQRPAAASATDSIKRIFCSGEVLPIALHNQCLDQLGAELHNLYGPTEAAIDVTHWRCRRVAAAADVPLGKPIANTRIYIVESGGEPAPIGVAGELWIGGIQVARGYINQPQLTAQQFVPDPFCAQADARAYRTGDLARIRADGVLEFLGRIDQQVKLRGYRIELQEIEAVLNAAPGVTQSAVLLREDVADDPRLTAYVVAVREAIDAAARQDWQREQVAQWHTLWQQTYASVAVPEDLTNDFHSWNSSYTGEPIPLTEMHEWLASCVANIDVSQVNRVLEIGSGSGLLIAQLGANTERYVATDFSAAAVTKLRHLCSSRDDLRHTEILQCGADEIERFAGENFDAVILNSVAQYFPDADYLVGFVRSALEALAPGGRLFLGDLRNLGLLHAYHASVAVFQADEALPVDELEARVRDNIAHEEELLVDPAFFALLADTLPELQGVRYHLKRGTTRNELSRYRYDVTLTRASGDQIRPRPEVHRSAWPERGLSEAELHERLTGLGGASLLLTGIPDARSCADQQLLKQLDKGAYATVAELRGAAAAKTAGIEPQHLYNIASTCGLDVQLVSHQPGTMSALFSGTGAAACDGALLIEARPRDWRDCTNEPLASKVHSHIIAQLRDHLKAALPEYMVPSHFVVLDRLPLTASGKVDRRALPAPERRRSDAQTYVAPRTELEQQLAELWSTILGISTVGVTDNFFTLGGHSLLATQLISRIRDTLHVELPLASLFSSPTIAGIADSLAPAGPTHELQPIARHDRNGPLPLSFAQQRLWFLSELEGPSATYTIPLALRITGELNIGALQAALDVLVTRHESLRTHFVETDGTPEQVVSAAADIRIAVLNRTETTLAERQTELEALARQPFNLTTDELLRVYLLRFERTENTLLLVMHHIISDGWSFGIFARELATLYSAECDGRAHLLPELPVQYADYAVWQREWLTDTELDRQLGYWHEQLRTAPPLLRLPTDYPRPPTQTFRGQHLTRTYDAALCQQLHLLADSHDCTLFMVLLAVYYVLLARYAAGDDIVIGSPIAGRTHSETEGLIGFFVNTLPLRTDISGDPDFVSLLARVKAVSVGAYAHQDLPFEKLVEELQPDRDTSHAPIVQTLFALQNHLFDRLEFGACEVTPVDVELGTAKFDLSLFMLESDAGLIATLEYNTDLFAASTVERLHEHLEQLLHSVVAQPTQRVSELALTSTAEQQRLLRNFQPVAQHWPEVRVHKLVEATAQRTPEAVALICEQERLSYAELNGRANCLARALQESGLGPGQFVAIAAERSAAQVLSILAVMKAGAAYIPLDPNYPAQRLQFMLEDSDAALLIVDAASTPELPAHQLPVLELDTFDWTKGDVSNLNAPCGDSVYVIYTSGSTGQPKGAELTHAGLANLIQWQNSQPGLDQPARTLQFASLNFDVSFQELFTTWAQGGSVVLIDTARRRDFTALAEFIATAGIERLYLPFAALQPLADNLATSLIDADGFKLRDVIVAGEQLQITPAISRLFNKLPTARLHNHYGPTETHVVTAFTLPDDRRAWPKLPPIGRPVANMGAYVLDAYRQPAPVGVPGELYVAGVQVAKGYLGRSELTAERFLSDPLSGGPMYRTGDRARRLNDGTLEYLGRVDAQLKWRGFRVEPGEVENRLLQYPGIQHCAVALRALRGGAERLVAYFVAAPNTHATDQVLSSWLHKSLPDYMVPSVFVALEALPLTPSGKLDRAALPMPEITARGSSYAPPRTPIEEALVEIWGAVLSITQVGINDDFFLLGGHSLLATQLIARVRGALEVEVPLLAVFEQPTVAEFAHAVEAARGTETPQPLVPRERDATTPLSFAQQRLWFLDQLEPGNPVYNLPWALELTGPLNISALQRTFDDLVARHESLHTAFESVLGKPRQRTVKPKTLPLLHHDARSLSGDQLLQQLRDLARQPFDLKEPPLLRVHVLQTGDDQHVVLLVLHHIIADGWSIGVLYREWSTLYAAHCGQESGQLPELAVQYPDFALWQRDWLQSAARELELDYWRQRLAGAPVLLELPVDRPRGPSQSYNGAFIEARLPTTIHEGLRDLAHAEHATLFMVCLAVFNVLLARHSGQHDICIGTPIAGRQHSELDSLIGCFLNTLVMRNDISGNPSFSECIRRVKQTALEAFAHQNLPFEQLVDELHPLRDMSHAPLFQVAFVMQNTPWDATVRLHDLEAHPLELDYGVAKFDLSLLMAERPDGLFAHFEYNSDLFDAATVQRLAGHFETLLGAVINDPLNAADRLPLMTDAERQHSLHEWNNTASSFESDACIQQLIEAQVAQQPNAVAIRCGTATLTFAELNSQANQIAHWLIAAGAGSGSTVGLCLERSPDLIAALLGILKAGSAYLPLDPEHPNKRLEWMLTDSQTAFLVTQKTLLDALPAHSLHVLCVDQNAPQLKAQPDSNPTDRSTADDLAYVIYTSGSTGRPKGVMIEHRGLCNLAHAQAATFGLGPGDRMLQFASISFDASIFEIVMALGVGATLVVAPADDLLPGAPLLNLLRQQRVTAVTLPPTALQQLPPAELPDLHTLTVAGEACPDDLVARWTAAGSQRRFFNLYGPTEATVWASFAECHTGQPVTIGGPIANTKLYVVDAHQAPVPVGVPGELYIGGPGVARGYLNQPELSAAKYSADPFSDAAGARVYRTGDRVRRRPDGAVEFLGRMDAQVKVRGFRIEPGEIEAALVAHPAVQEAVVLARSDTLDNRELVAYLVFKDGPQPSLSDLRTHLSQRLPAFMLPKTFVALEAMPLTVNRKIDRAALPDPQQQRLNHGVEFVAPRTEHELTLVNIWRKILRVEQVGINDNFFELGGDSILSIQIIAHAAQDGLTLTPKQIFQHQTVAELARAANAKQTVHAEQGLISGEVPLTPVQRWFAGRDVIHPEHFNQSQLLLCGAALDPATLEQALQVVVTHHDSLRLQVEQLDGFWRQTQSTVLKPKLLRTVSLEQLSLATQEHHQLALANALQADIDLAQGPLLRALLFKRGAPQQDRLLIVAHHMTVDWVSWPILLADLETAYRALEAGRQPALPRKTTSFKAWAERLERLADDPALQAQHNWWLSQPWDSAIPIAPDAKVASRARGADATAQPVARQLNVAETTQLVKELPQTARCRVDELLLTAVAQAACDCGGGSSALLDLEGHGREDLFNDIDLSRTVGWFTTLYPVLLRLPAAADAAAALQATKSQLRGIPQRGLGFGVLRFLSRNPELRSALAAIPKPQIGFNYLGRAEQITDADALLQPAPEPRGREVNPLAERPHSLEIAGRIVNEQLQLSIEYNADLHSAARIEHFADRIMLRLRDLLKVERSEHSAVLTETDFPLAELEGEDLNKLLATADDIEDIYKLTPLQHGMLFHSLLGGTSDVYLARFRWRLTGPLDAQQFAEAWRQTAARNQSLRAAFAWQGLATPVQIIHRDASVALQTDDWSELPHPAQQQRLNELLADDQQQGFDFSQAPLMRLRLIKLDADDHQFIWTFHHAIVDGWSIPLVLQDLLGCYEALCAGKQFAPPPRAPFRNYVRWLAEQDTAGGAAHWRRYLAGFNTPTPLPFATEQMTADKPDYGELITQLPANPLAQLRALAVELRVTLNTIVQGAWGLLLARHSGNQDVLFGATTSGRPAQIPGVASMVGLFLNTLAVRVRLDNEQTIAEWLAKLQDEQLGARQHEFSSLAEVQGWSEIPHGTPLFKSLLAFENYPDMATMWTDTETIGIREVEGFDRTNFPLTINVAAFDALQIRLVFDQQCVDRDAAEQIATDFLYLLDQLSSAPERRLKDVGILSSAARDWLLRDWNATARAYPTAMTLVQLFEHQVERTPDAAALICGAEELTYVELNARANRLAHYLTAAGVGPDQPVGVHMERSVELVVALYAIVKAGGAYVPLDPEYPTQRLEIMLEDAEPRWVLTHAAANGGLPGTAATVISLDDIAPKLETLPAANPPAQARADSLAYIIFTSGSTGRPKGVMTEHRAICNRLLWMQEEFTLTAADRVLQKTPCSFDVSVWELFWPLQTGAALVLAKPGGHRDSGYLCELIAAQQITTAHFVPSMLQVFLEHPDIMRANGLRRIFCSGEVLTPALQTRTMHKLDTELFNLYGPTEAAVDVTHWRCRPEPDAARVPIGHPVANTQIYVVDAQGELAAIGAPGELWVGGIQVARGYVNQPQLTAERFIPDPFSVRPNARVYRTGDIGRLRKDGALEFMGRLDEQIKLRGYRIELGDIESALAALEPVIQCAVALREDTPGDQRLIAYVCTDAPLSEAEILQDLRARLPDYMIPAAIVMLDSLPLTPSGKVDRRQLPAPELPAVGTYAAPRNATEETLAVIWAETLHRDRVGIHENFFALGGHSLIAMQLVSRIVAQLQVQLPLDALFARPTVAGLAESVRQAVDEATTTPRQPITRTAKRQRRRRKP